MLRSILGAWTIPKTPTSLLELDSNLDLIENLASPYSCRSRLALWLKKYLYRNAIEIPQRPFQWR